jgi:hypothetical protein
MGHKCSGEWRTWSADEVQQAVQADPDRLKGVTHIEDKVCDCGNVLGWKSR